jgi:adenylate cyclase
LRPLNTSQTQALIGELLGTDSSVHGLAEFIAERAVGNPFFAEEIMRDLAERSALRGAGSYLLHGEVADVTVPATLEAVIAARVDRLTSAAKRTLSAAAVIGSRFNPELVTALRTDAVLDDLPWQSWSIRSGSVRGSMADFATPDGYELPGVSILGGGRR